MSEKENDVCKGCVHNHFPECWGTKMFDGTYMRIDKLKNGFKCGQKDELLTVDFSIKPKTAEQLKIEELEARINQLEAKEP